MTCRYCQQPVHRCPQPCTLSLFPGPCRGWRHGDGWHYCAVTERTELAEPEPGQLPAVESPAGRPPSSSASTGHRSTTGSAPAGCPRPSTQACRDQSAALDVDRQGISVKVDGDRLVLGNAWDSFAKRYYLDEENVRVLICALAEAWREMAGV